MCPFFPKELQKQACLPDPPSPFTRPRRPPADGSRAGRNRGPWVTTWAAFLLNIDTGLWWDSKVTLSWVKLLRFGGFSVTFVIVIPTSLQESHISGFFRHPSTLSGWGFGSQYGDPARRCKGSGTLSGVVTKETTPDKEKVWTVDIKLSIFQDQHN